MEFDYSIFDEPEDTSNGEEGFADLELEEQFELVTKYFPIGTIVYISYENLEPMMSQEIAEELESIKYMVTGYDSVPRPDGFDQRLMNVILVEEQYSTRTTVESHNYHPGFLRIDKEWMRENKINNIID